MSFLELFFAHPLVQALGWTLIHFVWQGTVVALALGLLLVALGDPREGHGTAGPASKIVFTSLRDGNAEDGIT